MRLYGGKRTQRYESCWVGKVDTDGKRKGQEEKQRNDRQTCLPLVWRGEQRASVTPPNSEETIKVRCKLPKFKAFKAFKFQIPSEVSAFHRALTGLCTA